MNKKLIIVILMTVFFESILFADYTVGEGGDFGTIAEALSNASIDEKLVLNLIDPVYTESGLIIESDVEINGASVDGTVIQAAALPGIAEDRVFRVTAGGQAVFRDLTIRNGKPTAIPHRGGGIDNEGFVRLERCNLSGNEAVYGGGIFTRGRVELVDSSLSGNYTTELPNELINSGIGCRGSGGAIKTEKGGELIIDGCSIWDNYAFGRGGGVFVACESAAYITNTTIASNDCRRRGGGIYNNGDLFLNHVTIANNSSVKRGSGLCSRGRASMKGTLIAGSSFQDFYIAKGGGIYGEGFLEVNEGNFVADGSLDGAASGDPKLKALKTVGGNPPFMPIGIFSPARDGLMAEDTPEKDQRGRLRGRQPDIGAYEYGLF
ncbi:MAG: right-handed parallel beta-helix repeat-containing protein [Spirochaetales bacterium]|nr:right-handed parallel beta-helix repeat-containing protein [Spirochaetales bacterium]